MGSDLGTHLVSPRTSSPVKNPSARKSLCMFTNVLDVKKTAFHQVGADKSKPKANKFGNTPCSLKQKQKGHSKISEQIKKSLYNWIMHHAQVMQSPIENDCLQVKIDGYTEPQLVPKLLLQVSVREIDKNLVIATKYDGLKEARDEDDNIIISDSALRSLLPPHFKTNSSRYKVMCGCECCIYAKSINSSLISWRDSYSNKLKDLSQNV